MGRLPAWLALALAAMAAGPAGAQSIVTSARPESVDVTVYRAPGRSPDTPFDLEWLEGYALISETRTVSLPAGESEVRFEGVAGGILPQSAIVSGFPDGIVERNRDAYLLSPESLLDRSLGRRVHLRRRTATGAVREQDAVIRSGAGGAVVLETADGVEALRCTGLPETLIYDGVPAGLSARPTLSVRARASRPVTATITLAYLADGFDWQANYIAELAPSGDRIDLFAWLTLASNDETSFVDADTQAVAGRLNRAESEREAPEANPLTLRCWPQGRTGDVSTLDVRLSGTIRSEDLINELPQSFAADADEASIMVTGSRIPARQEDLGDLKLYRIPEPVTVAANSQKQVAFLQRAGVPVEFVYRQRLDPDDNDEFTETKRFLVARNRTDAGLGVPLPGGGFQLFTAGGGRPVLVGEGSFNDLAVGEDVEIQVGESSSVMARVEDTAFGDDWEDHLMTVTNAQPVPVRYEAEFDVDEDVEFRPRQRLGRRDGRPLWAVTVPANGTATLRYRVVERDD